LQWENPAAYADKMRMAANLDEIIATADEVYREPANHKNAEAFNRGKIKIRVGANAYEADVLTAIKPDTREIFYDIVNIEPTKIKPSGGTHVESEDSRSRLPESFMETSGGTVTGAESTDASRLPEASSQSITQDSAENKRTGEAVKKSMRFQMAEQALGCQLEVFLEPVGKNDIKHWSAPHPWHP
jgi:hypothetical protein